ncbi:MAG: type II toxin-antitoxin system VapC family toxin [Candidatus Sumerlaeota bacterium]|nr:type II toxin-antitoxin system VapC family toxin [Candidatus Sumerlaeota bacterium]
MPKAKLYLETSVISYYTARPSRDVIVLGHQQITWDFWEKQIQRFDVFISQIVVNEASAGDPSAARKRLDAIRQFPLLPVTPAVDILMNRYRKENIIPEKESADAYHIALASVHEIDYLATWNCQHIALASVRAKLARFHNIEKLYLPTICTPGELKGE